MQDSAYIIQIQLGDSEEIQQIFARNKAELASVIKVIPDEDTIAAVQSLGGVALASDYVQIVTSTEDGMNYGMEA